jgi:hypothetical protein
MTQATPFCASVGATVIAELAVTGPTAEDVVTSARAMVAALDIRYEL